MAYKDIAKRRAWDKSYREKHKQQILEYRETHREVFRKASLKYYHAHKNDPGFMQHKVENSRKWKQANPERYRKNQLATANTRSKRAFNNLYDGYVRRQIIGKRSPLKSKDIPTALVELKRADLKLKRKLKHG